MTVRPACLGDVPFMDRLQKAHTKQLGYFPTGQFEEYVKSGGVLVAEEIRDQKSEISNGKSQLTSDLRPLTSVPLGYIISRDRYLKRDELGVIYQLCVAPGTQRKLVGAALVREVFARSAYGCKLYCCWCAQDLEANYFWESLGFLPIAFRAGSSGKKRVHIFWQRRIGVDDATTPYWYPSQTNAGAIREDRLVFPIPPGVHWKDVQAVVIPEHGDAKSARAKRIDGPQSKGGGNELQRPTVMRRQFAAPTAKSLAKGAAEQAVARAAKPPRPPRPRTKINPQYVAAARELRDRWLEKVNENPALLAGGGKYHIARALAAGAAGMVKPIFGPAAQPPQLAA